jgi:hypothetical protein
MGEIMRPVAFEPARLLDTDSMPWIPTGPGKAFRPLRFAADGWSELMRLEPGSAVPLHRYTGDVHAFNLSGAREIFGAGERVGLGIRRSQHAAGGPERRELWASRGGVLQPGCAPPRNHGWVSGPAPATVSWC